MPKSLLSAMLVFVCSTTLIAEPKSWEFTGSGQWQAVTPAATQAAADPALDRIEELVRDGRGSSARKLAIQWVKTHGDHPARDRGLFLVAECLYQYGDRIKAYYYLDELMDEYPDSRLYYSALELQYKIADAYLNGYKRRFLTIPMFRAPEEAIEMMYRIQQRSPGSPLAEKALLRTADYYYDDRQFDFAGDVYGYYITRYSRSPNVPRARLRQAYASLAQFRGARFDATPIIDAREQLQELIVRYPELAQEENIPMLLERIDNAFAKKLFYTANFYRRTNEPRAAAYTFKYLVKAYPDFPEARQAREELNKMPRWALNTPEPAVVKAYAPGSSSGAGGAQRLR